MERRLLLFMALSILILMLNQALFAPKRPPAGAGGDAVAELPEGDGNADVAAEAAAPGEQPPAPIAGEENAEQGPEGAEPEEDIAAEYLTLGSVNPESGYRMLVTLTNEGAGVRRIELASPKYRDLHDRSGYFGQLHLEEDGRTGLLVRTVGPGTPAEAAGLASGDRIVAAGVGTPEPVASIEQYEALRSETKPKQSFTVEVIREGGEKATLTAELTRRPLEVIRPETEILRMRGAEMPDPEEFEFDVPSFLMTLEKVADRRLAEDQKELAGVELRHGVWRIAERDAESVVFEKRLGAFGVTVRKRFALEPREATEGEQPEESGYDLTLTVELQNTAEAARELAYKMEGPSGLPLEGWWYANKVGRTWSAVGLRDVVTRFEDGDPLQLGAGKIATGEIDTMEGKPLAYAGVDAQYFSVVMLPEKEQLSEKWIDQTRPVRYGPEPKGRSGGGRYANVSFELVSEPVSVAPGGSLSHSYTVFAGPKDPDLVAQYTAAGQARYSLSDLVYYGWFTPIAKLMLVALHFFYGIVGNYGVSIVMLTLVVRGSMFPLSRKQTLSMLRMQELKPQMDDIKAKYKDDMQKQSQAMQELYRKHDINPLAGCMPMLIQLPIFVALYRSLWVDVELRQAPLISEGFGWASDLAAPDMLLNWSGFMPSFITTGTGIFALGPYLNILPLVTVGIYLLQQKIMMPPPANEQAAMQQKMMKYMMGFIGILFYKVASGLCIYFIASSLWGIAERKMLPKAETQVDKVETGRTPPAASRDTAPRAVSNGKPKTKAKRRPKQKKRR